MSTITEMQTERVFSHHMQVLGARDLDGVMEDYTEDSVVIVNSAPEPLLGLTAIRALFAQVLEIFTPEVLAILKVNRQSIAGETAYVVWSAGATIPFGSDTFVVRDGKIVIQTAAVQMGQAG